MQEKDPLICAQCASKGPTCCFVNPGSFDSCFPLSAAEIEAINLSGQVKTKNWYVLTDNSKSFRKNLFRLFPGEKKRISSLFALNATHARLAISAQNTCFFLTQTGCTLTREVRPVFCRLFPFWVTWSKITYFMFPDCLVTNKYDNLHEIIRALHTAEKDIFDLYTKLRIKWGIDSKEIKKY